MEVCKNKQSQKYFIYLDEIGNAKDGLFINHQPRILRLPMNHFEEMVDEEETTLLSKGFITGEQINLYRQKKIKDDVELDDGDDTSQSHPRRRFVFHEHLRNKKYRQDDLIPLIVLLVGSNGGKATKSFVEATIYELFRTEFNMPVYQYKVNKGTIPRWKHDIAWARERAKQMHGYMEAATISGRGIWELTDKGKSYYERLVKELQSLSVT